MLWTVINISNAIQPLFFVCDATCLTQPAPSPDERHLIGPELGRAEVAKLLKEGDPGVIHSVLLVSRFKGRRGITQIFTYQGNMEAAVSGEHGRRAGIGSVF